LKDIVIFQQQCQILILTVIHHRDHGGHCFLHGIKSPRLGASKTWPGPVPSTKHL
jgi:hypothetical protein